jgi:hypothetical protein
LEEVRFKLAWEAQGDMQTRVCVLEISSEM